MRDNVAKKEVTTVMVEKNGAMSKHLEEVLQDISERLYEKMDSLLPDPEECSEKRLIQAMRYSALAPGKRLRPFLTVTSANLFGVSSSSALQAAAAIEFIHTYSLIHDDLPAMDNDDMRRGQPSCHKQFDEATAILAGDGLLTYAFEVLSDKSTHSSNNVRCELIRSLGKAAGWRGMVAGQMMDLASEGRKMSINEIIHLQRLKTGELFAVSCEAGAILGNAAPNLRNLLRGYAHDIGLAFQITDDLLDAEAGDNDNERQDKSSGKATFVSAMGIVKAREQAKILAEQAIGHLHVFGKKAELLRDLARYIVERKS
jgi:farnesyl diphosphate synthase